MKRQTKKIAKLIIMFCFTFVVLASCSDADEDIFNNVPNEEMTDEEDEKKSKPG